MLYTLFVILGTIVVLFGLVFWILMLFGEKMNWPFLKLFVYILWPLSLTIIILWVALVNDKSNEKRQGEEE
jgi:hypothetical protein